MKKYYFFAALATVGLFASCSSDEDFSDASEARQAVEVDDNAPAPIVIDVAQLGSRGTGTVGGIDAATNKWAGQKFSLIMLQKGTLLPYYYYKTEADKTNDVKTWIFKNDSLETSKTGQTAAEYKIGTEKQYTYFPTSGAFSFWAYRIDDAGWDPATNKATTNGWPEPVNLGDDTKDSITVPFKIDGSQDIMLGKIDEDAALAKLQTKLTTATANDIFSAKAARRGINPVVMFSHMLTRLTFEVIADDKSVSKEAVNPGVAAGWEAGYKVTKITVRSKDLGELTVASKDVSAYNTANINDHINFTNTNQNWADPSTLTPLELKERVNEVNQAADVYMIALNPSSSNSVAIAATYTFPKSGQNAAPVGASTTVNFNDDTEFYTTNVLGADGLPTSAKFTKKYAVDNGVTQGYYMVVRAGDHGDAENTPWSKATYKGPDAAAKLVALTPVVPDWNGVDAVDATLGAETQYSGATEFAANGNADLSADAAYPLGGYDDLAALEAISSTSGLTAGAKKVQTNDGKYYTLTIAADGSYTAASATELTGAASYAAAVTAASATSITSCADLAAAKVDAKTKTTVASYFYATTDGNYYEIPVTAAATAKVDNTAKTRVGEAMFVAPADENGYEVEIFYTRTKKDNAATATSFPTSAKMTVKRQGKDEFNNPTPAKFNAGKTYNIVIRIYADGEIKFDDVTDGPNMNPWGTDEGDNGGIEEEYSAEE